MPGPPRTPTAILAARGSWRAKTRSDEPKPPAERPSCPKWLRIEAKAEWRRQVKALEQMGLLAKCDRALLGVYCEAWADLVELSDLLCVVPAEGDDARRLARYRHAAADRLLKTAQQFGFSPAARARLHTEYAARPLNV